MRYSLLTAALAMAVPAFAADDDKCKDVTIKSSNPSTSCKDGTITGDVTVDGGVSDTLNLSGFKKIEGDLKIVNASKLLSIQSSDLTEIGGSLEINHCVLLGEINFSGIKKVKEIHLTALNQLQKINLGTSGKTRAKVIEIADTGLSDLSGLNVAEVDSFKIYTNKQLNMFNSDLTEISDELVISKNGKNMDVNMTVLESAKQISVDGGVRSFNVPSLQKISALRFTDNPNLESFTSKNLTQIGLNVKETGSLSFIGNDKLTNISFPQVTKIYGDLTVKNNTEMTELTGFPKLKSISGALLIAGEFKEIDLPKLTRVDGAGTITSTKDIHEFCDNGFKKFDAQSAKNQCKGKNPKANNAKNGDELGGSSSDDDDDKTDAANAAVVSMTTLAAAPLVGVYQLL